MTETLPGIASAADIKTAMIKAIQYRHNDIEWHLFFELRHGTGYIRGSQGYTDAYAIHQYPSIGNNVRHAYEIKISRGDFLRELKNKGKRRMALRYSNHFWFITPPGVAKAEEIPSECGLIEVEGVEHRKIIEAPYRDSCPPTWQFVASMIRNARKK